MYEQVELVIFMGFPSHGTYKLVQDRQIVVFKSYGCWNYESANAITQKLVLAVHEAPSPVGLILDTSELEGFTDDSRQVWLDLIQLSIDEGLSAFVRIDSLDSANYRIYIAEYDDLLRKMLLYHHTCNVEDGAPWLNQKGYAGFEQESVVSKLASAPLQGDV